MATFVELGPFRELTVERADRLASLLDSQRRDQTRVEPAAQVSAHRHIAPQMQAYGVGQQFL